MDLVSHPVFSVGWVTGDNRDERINSLLALDPTGQIVTIEVLNSLDSAGLVAALARTGRHAEFSRQQLAGLYPGGPLQFSSDWSRFVELTPPTTRRGPRLILFIGSASADVISPLGALAGAGVEAHRLVIHEGISGLLVEFIPVGNTFTPMIGSAARILELGSSQDSVVAEEESVETIDPVADDDAPASEDAPVVDGVEAETVESVTVESVTVEAEVAEPETSEVVADAAANDLAADEPETTEIPVVAPIEEERTGFFGRRSRRRQAQEAAAAAAAAAEAELAAPSVEPEPEATPVADPEPEATDQVPAEPEANEPNATEPNASETEAPELAEPIAVDDPQATEIFEMPADESVEPADEAADDDETKANTRHGGSAIALAALADTFAVKQGDAFAQASAQPHGSHSASTPSASSASAQAAESSQLESAMQDVPQRRISRRELREMRRREAAASERAAQQSSPESEPIQAWSFLNSPTSSFAPIRAPKPAPEPAPEPEPQPTKSYPSMFDEIKAARRRAEQQIWDNSAPVDHAKPLLISEQDSASYADQAVEAAAQSPREIAAARLRGIAKRLDTPVELIWASERRVEPYRAELMAWGSIKLETGESHSDPTIAAVSISGDDSVNGWDVWCLADGRRLRELPSY